MKPDLTDYIVIKSQQNDRYPNEFWCLSIKSMMGSFNYMSLPITNNNLGPNSTNLT